jgi:hypothetical protein
VAHRKLKRVPLNFDWPLNTVWRGYINPFPSAPQCTQCKGEGTNWATRKIAEEFYDHDGFGDRWRYDYGFAPDGTPATRPPWRIVGDCKAWHNDITPDEVAALVARNRLRELTHTRNSETGEWQPKTWEQKGFWCPRCNSAVPQLSAEHHSATCLCTGEATPCLLLEGDDQRLHLPSTHEVNQWNQRGFGHDTINRWILTETRAKRLGVWGLCPKCEGRGTKKFPRRLRMRHEQWKPYEPPDGSGYQLWECVSEGSPITPVFSSAEELAVWCAVMGITCGSGRRTFNEWLMMFEEDSVAQGSMMVFVSMAN